MAVSNMKYVGQWMDMTIMHSFYTKNAQKSINLSCPCIQLHITMGQHISCLVQLHSWI